MNRIAGAAAMIAVAVTCARPAAADDQFMALAGVAGAVLAAGVAGELLGSETVFIGPGTNQIDAVAGLGFYGLWDGHLPDRQFGLGRLEVRFAPVVGVRPIIGVEGTTGGSIYVYGGGMVDVHIGENFTLSPSLAVGYYEPGDVDTLGSAIEFRTGVEAAYSFEGGMRVGVAYQHISNAEIGDVNPGTETLSLNLSLPLN
jgi:lipid A 3-O-deacylase